MTADNSYLRHSLKVYIQSLTTTSGSSLFGSVIEHRTFKSAARVQISPVSWDFFSLMCYGYVPYYGSYVIRCGFSARLD